MARKRKASELKNGSDDPAAHEDASVDQKLAKVDWSAMGEFKGFTVSAVKLKPKEQPAKPASKKQKTNKASRASEAYKNAPLRAEVVQPNPFLEIELQEVYWKIKPAREWESTQRYRKFTISGEEFEVNNFVFVERDPESPGSQAPVPDWVAKVLEVRAGDAQHVFLRVYWAYRPEDLPGGRQPHHGDCELIVSNHMDVIDALCVQGAADVIHWDDGPDHTKFPKQEQLYWRQGFDFVKRKGSQFTKINTYCIDAKPSNPDEYLIKCPACSGYLHARCLEERAVNATHNEQKTRPSESSAGKRRQAWKGFFEAKIDITKANELRLSVTDKRKGKKNATWDVDVHCLLCEARITNLGPSGPLPRTPAAQITDDDEVEEEEEDTAISPEASSPGIPHDEATLGIADIPTSATVAGTAAPAAASQAPRKRGRPKGSKKNKGRGRPSKVKEEVVEEEVTSLPRETGQMEEETVAQQQVTPPPAPAPASVLQSGVVRSVTRLLWRS
ncbi:hypothetical protein NX059_003757 [Plenodomus lindquistii]|nr:hypothetical protein NX059_003757 [Plenodomus lindquistii]